MRNLPLRSVWFFSSLSRSSSEHLPTVVIFNPSPSALFFPPPPLISSHGITTQGHVLSFLLSAKQELCKFPFFSFFLPSSLYVCVPSIRNSTS